MAAGASFSRPGFGLGFQDDIMSRAMTPSPDEQKVLDVLRQLGIPWERHEHPPVFTVDQAEVHWQGISGLHVKNLFLRNDRGNRHFLVILGTSKKVDLKVLAKLLGEDRFSFASAERLKRCLGVEAGSVSAFSLINDADRAVEVVIDEDLKTADRVGFHPNDNTVTLTIRSADLMKYLGWTGLRVRYLKF
jgi:Ala-tRNA(Pro) deacylase